MTWIRRFVILWAFNVVALFVADWIVDGIHFDDKWTVVIAGAVFAIVNMIVKPIVTFLAIPLIILTLGIALFFVNLLMLYITSWIVSGFEISGFWSAVGATIIVWIVNSILNAVFGVDDWRDERRRRRIEPSARPARRRVREIGPGLWHWTTIARALGHPDQLVPPRGRAGRDRSARAPGGARVVRADGGPIAALLTNRHHYRHAGRFAERFGTRVLCNRLGAQEFGSGEPVEFFTAGDELPGGVRSVRGRRHLPRRDGALQPRQRALAVADGLVRFPPTAPSGSCRISSCSTLPAPARACSRPTAPCWSSTSTPSCPPTGIRSSGARRRRCATFVAAQPGAGPPTPDSGGDVQEAFRRAGGVLSVEGLRSPLRSQTPDSLPAR